MFSLSAVVPDGLAVRNADGVGQDVCCSTERCVGRHEAREETVGGICLNVVHGNTRVLEGGSDD